MRLTMTTNRSYRWLHTLHLAPTLPDNIGDRMSCPNGHPLQIFAFLPTSGRSRLRIHTALLPGLAHDQIPHPEHRELLLSSCRVYVTYIPLSWLPNAIKMNYNYFSIIQNVTIQFYPEFENKFICSFWYYQAG